VIGFSKGGIAALYASLRSVREALAHDGQAFAAHIAYYPWCGLRFLSPRTTGAPILIQSGGADEITPPGLCRDLIDKWRKVNPSQQADMVVYDGARHGFDHPSLKNVTWAPVGGVTPSSCLIREVRPGAYVEQSTGRPVTSGTLQSVIWDCSGAFGIAGGDADAGRQALLRTKRFLRATLLH
jgi:dienelactone hydrolase